MAHSKDNIPPHMTPREREWLHDFNANFVGPHQPAGYTAPTEEPKWRSDMQAQATNSEYQTYLHTQFQTALKARADAPPPFLSPREQAVLGATNITTKADEDAKWRSELGTIATDTEYQAHLHGRFSRLTAVVKTADDTEMTVTASAAARQQMGDGHRRNAQQQQQQSGDGSRWDPMANNYV